MKKDPIKPDTCIEVDTMPSIHDTDIKLIEVPLIRATKETFKNFGHLVTDFEKEQVIIETWPAPGWRRVEEGTGNEGGVTSGKFIFEHLGQCFNAHNHAVNGNYISGWFSDPASAVMDKPAVSYESVYVREANYHPDGGQVFYPTDGSPFVALLALPGDDISPNDFVAFYCDGSFGIQILPNIWHQPVFPLTEKAEFDGKQGRVHACIACDFVKEFGCYLSVPLKAC